MVCMIADYRENGVDMHNEYIAGGTNNYDKAAEIVVKLLTAQGNKVSCITVCPDVSSLKELRRMENEGFRPGKVYLQYVFGEIDAEQNVNYAS